MKEVEQVIKYCKQTGYASHDFETKATGPHGDSWGEDDKPTGPQFEEDEPTIISLCFQPGSAYSIPLFHFESPFKRKQAEEIIQMIGHELMANPQVTKVAWNLKFEYKWFLRYGITMLGQLDDAMLMKYLLDEERPHGLKPFVESNFPDFANYEAEINEIKKRVKSWAKIPLEPLSKYCCADSDLTLRAAVLLEKSLKKEGFYMLYRNMCMMQTRVLAESESMGMLIDKPYVEEIIKSQKTRIEANEKNILKHPKVLKYQRWRRKEKVKKLIEETQKEIDKINQENKPNKMRLIAARQEKISRYIAGQLATKKERVDDFNPNSPNQLVELLFTSPAGFRFKIVKYTVDDRKQPTDRPSTDEEVLLKLKRKDKTGFLDRLLSQREMVKLYSTYMVAPHYHLTKHNTLHSSFLIIGTVTGRLSSKGINMQNIPRDTTSSVIKKMFIPPPGHLLLEVDYGQAELRVVAELAKDEAMIEIFKKGYNVHLATGLKIVGEFERYEEIKSLLKDPNHPDLVKWEKIKKKGKVLNFSILYLQSDEQTAEQMETSVQEAAEFKEGWFNAFPKIKQWMRKQELFVKKHGYVVNMFGRHRRLPGIWDYNRGTQNKAIRDSINAPIQGASSDFTQFATVIIRERIRIRTLKLTDSKRWNKQAYTVHDSIGFYIKPEYIAKAVPIIESICSDPETLRYFGFEMKYVKMKVSAEIGTTWGGLQEYNPKIDYNTWISK
jgi:DNA polymerase I-like protein with 3'-5' exonuclease and polymerase domains